MSKYDAFPVTRLFAESQPAARPQHRLQVDTGSSLGEVFVIDGGFNLVARGQGRLDTLLPAGDYLVKYRNGDRLSEQWVELTADVTRNWYEAPLPPTAAPISERTGWGTPDAHFADSLRRRHRLSIIVRGEDGVPPLDDVQILSRTGEKIVRMADATATGWELGSSPCTAGFGGDLPDGGYLLRVATPGLRPYLMALWVAPGCSTQVFMRRQSLGVRGARRKGPHMASASIFIAQPEAGMDELKPLLQLTESAKSVLSYDRLILPDEQEIRLAVSGKVVCPIAGLLAGHLLRLKWEDAVRRREPEAEKLRRLLLEVVGNMIRLMPGSPDVGALALSLELPADADFGVPPMLAHSWAILNAMPESPVPKNSYAARILPAVVATRPWLLWNQSLMLKRK